MQMLFNRENILLLLAFFILTNANCSNYKYHFLIQLLFFVIFSKVIYTGPGMCLFYLVSVCFGGESISFLHASLLPMQFTSDRRVALRRRGRWWKDVGTVRQVTYVFSPMQQTCSVRWRDRWVWLLSLLRLFWQDSRHLYNLFLVTLITCLLCVSRCVNILMEWLPLFSFLALDQ